MMNAFTPGLVSVTFRQLPPAEIVDLCVRAGLRAIEWGGDVHVPPGDLGCAAEVRRMTADAGLSVAAYGSYLRLGEYETPASFEAVIETARALGAPSVRVWAGKRGSAQADDDYRRGVAEDALYLAGLAAKAEIFVCYEYHAETLTDTDASALELLRATHHPAIYTLWQPPHGLDVDARCASLVGVLRDLKYVHVFHWPQRGERVPLAAGAAGWLRYLRILREHGRACPLLLEFVRDDDPAQLLADATTLHKWIAATNDKGQAT
jgi:sugar phosphate isomerase/epimerase